MPKNKILLVVSLVLCTLSMTALSQPIDQLTVPSSAVIDTNRIRTSFSTISEHDIAFVEEDRRSKRIALDSLFQLLVERDKGFMVSGQFLNTVHWDGKTDNSINALVGVVDLFTISSFGEHALAFVNLRGIGGAGPGGLFDSYSGFHAGATPTQASDGLDRITIFEAWAEYQINRWTFIGGKLDLTNYFDPNSVANDEYSQFLSNALVNNISWAIPSNGAAMLVRFDVTDRTFLSASISSADQNAGTLGDDLFRIAQISQSLFFGGRQRGGIRVFVYDRTSISRSFGYGISADYRLIGKLHLFGRYGKNQEGWVNNYSVEEAFSGGFQIKKFKINGELDSTFGIAQSVARGFRPEQSGTLERMYEAYFRSEIIPNFHFSPHFQYVFNAMGSERNLSIWAVRARIGF